MERTLGILRLDELKRKTIERIRAGMALGMREVLGDGYVDEYYQQCAADCEPETLLEINRLYKVIRRLKTKKIRAATKGKRHGK